MPLAYFLTFSTYGSHLPGNGSVSTSRRQNAPFQPTIPEHAGLEATMREYMAFPEVSFDAPMRAVVEDAMHDRAAYREWAIHALNVRTNHVHIVISAENASPEYVMQQLKGRATRMLREQGLIGEETPVWGRHGSTRWLWSDEDVIEAIDYTLFRQGAWLT